MVIAIEPNPECVQYLKFKYRFNKRVIVVSEALDAVAGRKKLYLCEVNSLATLAPDWIRACKESKRYDEFNWNKQIDVEADTLDNLIKKYGKPDYLKIDVEGNELNVLKGLSSNIRFNLSSGESAVKFDLPEWITAAEMATALEGKPRFGYLWAR